MEKYDDEWKMMMSRGKIPIFEEDIAPTKAENNEFQEIKNSDKAIAGKASKKQKGVNAWIGAFEETKVPEFFEFHGIPYEHFPYAKQDSSQPDFIIDGLTVDTKITRSSRGMYMQPIMYDKPNVKWNIYMAFRTSWSSKGKEEEKTLAKIFARGDTPYLEFIGFSTNGFMKTRLATESPQLAKLLEVKPTKMPKVWWSKKALMRTACGLEKNAPAQTKVWESWSKKCETWVFPETLLFQHDLFVEAFNRTDVSGMGRFSKIAQPR
jgi:hypothetical protein